MMTDVLQLSKARGDIATYPPGATFGPRRQGDYELVWIIQGSCLFHHDGHTHVANPGAVIIARPGMEIAFTWDREQRTRHGFIHFMPDALPDRWPSPEQWPVIRDLPDEDIIRPISRYMLGNGAQRSQAEPDAPVPPLLCRAMEVLLEAFIADRPSQAAVVDRDYPRAVAAAITLIRQSLDRDPAAELTLDDLAEASAVSTSHLCRLFKKTLGVGPAEAVRILRLDIALLLLSRSNLSVAEIAYRCGFASPEHFSRRFRSQYKLPPGKLREAMDQGRPAPVTPLVREMFGA